MTTNIQEINKAILEALNLEGQFVTAVQINFKAGEIPVVTTERNFFEDISSHIKRTKESSKYQEVTNDERQIVLVEEMAKYFQEKLLSTRSFDDAFTKAIWRAYLHGIKVGSQQATSDHLPLEMLG